MDTWLYHGVAPVPGEVAVKPLKLMFTCCPSALRGIWNTRSNLDDSRGAVSGDITLPLIAPEEGKVTQ